MIRRRKKAYLARSNDINYYLRNRPALKAWRKRWLDAYGGKCAFTQGKVRGRVHVHHIKAHHIIRDEVFRELNIKYRQELDTYTPEELMYIEALYTQKHLEVKGIPMVRKIHKLFHHTYGYNASLEDLKTFAKKYNLDLGNF